MLEDANATRGGGERQSSLAAVILFGVVATVAAVDLATDLAAGSTLRHVAVEALILLAALAGAAVVLRHLGALARETQALRERAEGLEHDLDSARRDRERWQREAGELVSGLSEAIDRQLEQWDLSAAEKEIALLLLKGLSHKEVAALRGTSEATVRQQARALYKKAGLSGRADLAAFFLEDLLGPRQPGRAGQGRGALSA